VGILRAGELVALESIATLREKMVRRMTVRFAGTPPTLDHLPGVVRSEARGKEMTLFIQGDVNALVRQLAICQIEHLVFPEPELEDIFAHYYNHRQQSTAPAV
jgi:hypothetical protein